MLVILIVFLIMFPMAAQKENKKEELYITPQYFIQKVSRNNFVSVKYDEITSFKLDDKEIVLGNKERTITLSMSMYKECLEIVIDILESFGKTFDKQKDFMKRPVEIIIDGENVIIKDLVQEISHFETVAGTLLSKYDMLTPGFINEVLLKNAIVEKAYIKSKDWYLEVSHFEVNPGHPENVLFDPIIVEDCILVFEAPVITTLLKRDTNARTAKFVEMEPSITVLNESIVKGIISDWKYNKGSIDLHFAVGVSTIKTNISYKDVLIGWNTQR